MAHRMILLGVTRNIAGFAGSAILWVAATCGAQEYDWTEPIPNYVIELFEPRYFEYSGGRFQAQKIAYRLFKPRRLRPSARYPIIVWTAGYGERGNDNVGQLMHLDHLFEDREDLDQYPFFILAMQNPPGTSGWVQQPGNPRPDDPATIQMAILDYLLASEPIDRQRIYLAGISDGGSACWEMAMRHPGRFAAAAPMSSAGTDLSDGQLVSLIDLPIWAFHCARDPNTPSFGVRQTVARLQAMGGNVALTEIDNASHDSWTPAFRDYNLKDWLLSHELGSDRGYSPGVVPWQWWHLTPVPGTIIGILIAWRVDRSRRAESSSHSGSPSNLGRTT